MTGNIYINGLIGTLLDEKGELKQKGVELIDVILQVKNQPKANSFNVYINSEGGVFTTGYEIYDYLKGLGKPIKTIGQGLVASMATVIFAAGTVRELRPGTEFYPHLPSGGVEGNSEDIQGYAELIKNAEKRILKTYLDDAGLSETEILPILRKNEAITAEQAYKLGFATVKPLAIEPVAYFKKDKPKINKMSKTDKTSIWQKLQNILKDEVILNKVVFTATGELDFYELEDDATPAVGDRARVDGQEADGEYVVPNEENPDQAVTYIFVSGELTEIKEPEAEEADSADGDNAMTALQEENERLTAELTEIQAKVTEKETAIENLKEKNTKLKAVVSKIKALESEEEIVSGVKEKTNPNPKPKISALGEAITNLKNKKKNVI